MLKSKNKTKESTFANEIKRSFDRISKQEPLFYLKIPDSFGMERFTSVKFFDAFVVNKSNFIAIEYKLVKGTTSFSFNRVREIQEAALWSINEAGGISYIIINYRKQKFNVAFAFYIHDYLNIKEIYLKQGRKSIPWKDLEQQMKQDLLNTKNKIIETPLDLYPPTILSRKKYDNVSGLHWDVENLL